MKQNAYVSQILLRENLLRNKILDFFLGLASYPRLLLEVFIRKNFGVRYFNLASAISVILMALIIPSLSLFSSIFYRYGRTSNNDFLYHYGTWYLFIIAFSLFAYKRWREVKTNPSCYDLARVSSFPGEINLKLYNFPSINWYPDIKAIEIVCEPAIFLLIGIVAIYFGQYVGWLFIVSSIAYSLSYVGAYKKGDDFIMNQLDKLIINANLKDVILNDRAPEQAGGVRIYAKRPASPDIREQLLNQIMNEEEETVFAE